jgi:3-dehydroquinate synthase
MSPSYIFNIPSVDMVTEFYFNADIKSCINNLFSNAKKLIIIDENVWSAHQQLWEGELIYIVPSGESSKTWDEVAQILNFLLENNFHKSDWILGIGGGVVTDLVGFVGAIYKRGIKVAFFPTTILAMVDASIGGKNGVNFGDYKNMVGTIRQPNCIIYDFKFLRSLPHDEWVNGFAEILKHAFVFDAEMFNILQQNNVTYYKQNISALITLIKRNVQLKCAIVQKDMEEKSVRKLLNYGHSIAHGLERLKGISHGGAVAIGMSKDAQISDRIFNTNNYDIIQSLIKQYELPTHIDWDVESLLVQIKQDKKAGDANIDYILLKELGHGVIHEIDMLTLKKYLE